MLDVSPSEIQPCWLPPGLASAKVMKVGVDKVLSGAKSSKSWLEAMAWLFWAKLAWFFLMIVFIGPM